MDLELEWLLKTDGRFWQEEELRADINLQCLTKCT